MNKAEEQDKERILQYLREGVQDCLYIYIDIMNYGVVSPNMQVWYAEEQGELSLVAMKYYDSYQVYSHKKDCVIEELCRLLRENPTAMISGPKQLIGRLEERFSDYRATYGVVFHGYPPDGLEEAKYNVMRATEEDTLDIAKLMCSDNNFAAHYTVEGLRNQLAERIRTGTGRSYIARNDQDELIAHSAVFAETGDIAVLSGAIVVPDYRKTSVFMELDAYMRYQLGREQKEMYAFAISRRMIFLQQTLGTVCGEYGKLEKRK